MTAIAHLSKHITDFCSAAGVPGFVAGAYRDGEVAVTAHGVANLATGAPMREDTGFLFGSITKIMTTTLVLRQVERGALDLDAAVADHLPSVRVPGLRVRHLLSHSSGIDADLFFPESDYIERLGRECGQLFEPGRFASYSNGGMIVAGRLLEVITGRDYHDLLESEVFAPAGMETARTSAERAILRSTAVGHFADPVTGNVRPTEMFCLPRTWGPAGATPIGTVEDLLAFGRVHLGERPDVLSTASVARMRTVEQDNGTPDSSPVGLGWLVRSMGGATVLTMTGASPGGVAMLAVVPSQRLVLAAYGNDARVLPLHEELLSELVGETEQPVHTPRRVDLRPYAGTYRSHQLRVDVRVVDGGLEETVTYEPADPDQERVFTGFVGGAFEAPPMRYVAVGEGLFAPAGVPLDGLPSYHLVSYHDGAAYRCSGGRMTRRASA